MGLDFIAFLSAKGQIISKGLLVSSNSPKKRTNEFVFTTTMNLFVRFLGEFEETKKFYRNYLTFNKIKPSESISKQTIQSCQTQLIIVTDNCSNYTNLFNSLVVFISNSWSERPTSLRVLIGGRS